jgi:tRNA (guanine37-N1)-methyltransferase
MLEKEEIEAQFYQDKYFYADMISALRDNRNRVAYAEEDGVLLRMRSGDMNWLTAKTPEAAERMLDFTKRPDMFLIHQDFCKEIIARRFGFCEEMRCWQGAYFGTEPLPVVLPEGMELRDLRMEDLDLVMEKYTHADGDRAYIAGRIKYGMIGAYFGGTCAGFIGVHGEGSMGLLEVFPEYRRMGVASALEGAMANRMLAKGLIPFGHVVVGNEASRALQKKLGFTFAEQTVSWLFKG